MFIPKMFYIKPVFMVYSFDINVQSKHTRTLRNFDDWHAILKMISPIVTDRMDDARCKKDEIHIFKESRICLKN